MFELKPLNKDAIPAALDKAMRYRLLNEPGAAESICLDVLRIDPENQQGEGNPCPQRQRDDTRTYDPRELAADEPDGSGAF